MTCIHLYMLVLRVIDPFPASPTIDHPPLQCFSVSGVITRATPHLQNPCSNFPDTFWTRLPGWVWLSIWPLSKNMGHDCEIHSRHSLSSCVLCMYPCSIHFPKCYHLHRWISKEKENLSSSFHQHLQSARLETCVFEIIKQCSIERRRGPAEALCASMHG